jgi:glutamate racemase
MIITIIRLQEVQVPQDLIRLHRAEVDVQVEEAAAAELVAAVEEDNFKSFYSTRVLTVMLGAWVFF